MDQERSENTQGISKMMTAAEKKMKMWFKNSASGWKASSFITGAVVCKSAANYAIVWSLMDFIASFWGKSIGFSAAIINMKEGFESLVTILGIFISDTCVGPYIVVLVSMTLYINGLLLFSLSVPSRLSLFCLAMVLLAAGEGGMESTLREFGVDQFPIEMETEELIARPSRVRWYGCSFTGSILGMLISGFILRNYDAEQAWRIGGFISTALMVGAFYLIVAGSLLYKIKRPQDNPYKLKMNVLAAAIPKRNLDGYVDDSRICGRKYPKEDCKSGEGQGRKKGLSESNSCKELLLNANPGSTTCSYPSDSPANLSCSIEDATTSGGTKDDSQIRSGNGRSDMEVGVDSLTSDNENPITIDANDNTDGLPRTDQLRCMDLDEAAIVETTSQSAEPREESELRLRSQTEVEEAKTFSAVFRIWTTIGILPFWTALRLFPIWTTFLMYGMVLSMGETFFLEQASSLDLEIGDNYQLPQTFLIAVSALSKIFISQACLPLLSWVTGPEHGIPPTVRIGAGQILVTLCCFTASLVEAKRLNEVEKHHLQDNTDDPVPMSVVWLVPQYVLSGAMNALLSYGISDFFVDQVPSQLRRCKAIFSETVVYIGRILSGLAIVVTSELSKVGGRPSWFADNINRCRLDNYYMSFAFLSLVNLFFYVYFAKRHPWNMATEEKTETDELLTDIQKEGMKAPAQDQKIRQDKKEEDAKQSLFERACGWIQEDATQYLFEKACGWIGCT